MAVYKEWTMSEMAKLKRLYRYSEQQDLIDEFGRTWRGIVSRASKLGLKRTINSTRMSYIVRIIRAKDNAIITERIINNTIRSKEIRNATIAKLKAKYTIKLMKGIYLLSVTNGLESFNGGEMKYYKNRKTLKVFNNGQAFKTTTII